MKPILILNKMLKNTLSVWNIAHNTIEYVLCEIKFKIYCGVVIRSLLPLPEISEAFEVFISHYNLSRYEAFYKRCCCLLKKNDIIQ